jgi:hypothetical protein
MPGTLNETALRAVLGALPLDITCVDADNVIRFYSDYRIFERKSEILGTRVEECHSPASRVAVSALISDLRAGKKEAAEFIIDKNGRQVRIRYYALRDAAQAYLGMMETAEWLD